MSAMIPLFEEYSMIWMIDADTIITNMNVPIHTLPCLGKHMTVCEENMVYWNRINCGSVVYKNTPETKWLLQAISDHKEQWRNLPCQAQTWLAEVSKHVGDIITIAPANSFNSVEWNLQLIQHNGDCREITGNMVIYYIIHAAFFQDKKE